jgi:hypothetical protein
VPMHAFEKKGCTMALKISGGVWNEI